MLFVCFQHLISPGSLVKTFLGGENWVRRKDATSSAHLSTVSPNIPQNSSGKLLDISYSVKKVLQKNMKVKIPCGLLHEVTTTRHELWFRILSREPLKAAKVGWVVQHTYLTFSYILSSWAVAGHHWRQDFCTKRGFCMQTLSLSTSDVLPQYKLPEGSGSKPQTQPRGFSRPPLPIPDLLLLS